MIQEDKQLLLKDLCARLPYNVVAQYSEKIPQWFTEKYGFEFERENIVLGFKINYDNISYVREKIDYFKPYLRPMSTMTEEERETFNYLCESRYFYSFNINGRNYDYYDWLNSNHFDYRDLIEKGLALEAPEGMYKID